MAGSWLNLKTLKNTAVFLLGRFPFINAGLLLMILGERANIDKNKPPFDVDFIYGYVILMGFLGVCMCYDYKRKECTIAYIFQLYFLAYLLFIHHEKLGYSLWLTNRLISRTIGLSGVYIIYVFLTSIKKSRQLQKIGEGCLAVFSATSMYILVNSAEDRDLFVSKIPFKTVSLFFLVTVMGACAMIYINGGIFLTDASQAMMCINFALVVCIYCDLPYWVGKRGVPYWIQIKLITDDIAICIGLFVMAFAKIYWKHRLPKEDRHGNLYRHESPVGLHED